MDRLKRIVAAMLLLTFIFASAGCGQNKQRGPLDVKKVTYVEYSGYINYVEVYIITSDRKVTKYSVYPEDGHYDYLAGELPSEDKYEVKEYETSELSWTSLVNVLTRVNFMELKEDLSTTEIIDDASSYDIKVETSDAVHTSGGYAAGLTDDSDNRRFAEAQQYIRNAVRDS